MDRKPNEHFRHVLLFYFRKGRNASQAHKKLCAVYGDGALKERQCQNWFAKFRAGDFSLKDKQRSGRPVEIDDEQIKAIIDANRYSTIREMAQKLDVSHTCMEKRLKQLNYVKKLDLWVPYELKEIHLTQRIDICDSLLKRNENDPFLNRMITGGQKWVGYNIVNRKRSWSKQDDPSQTTSKPNINQKKVMLSVWWDYKGILHFEILPRNEIINSDIFIQQLTKLNFIIQEKRPELLNIKGVVFHHDNPMLHTSLVTREKLLEFNWDVLPHPPYSPDFAPSDFYLFNSLQNFLDNKVFKNDEDFKLHLVQFFVDKDQKFFEDGITMLPDRWKKVIEEKGQYINE